jgi:hypothetical protein
MGAPKSSGNPRSALVAACVVGCIVGLVATASGCGDSEESKTSEEATEQPVPQSLGEVESGAEDIVDFARAAERSKVVATARELQRVAEGEASSALRKAGTPQARIASLQDRAKRLYELAPRAGFLRVSLAANQVSALMPALYARYSDPVPPQVLKLDYLDREAQLRSLARDRPAVLTAVSGLTSTWEKLRPEVIEAGGDQAAAAFARHVGAMRRLAARSDQALRREAVRGLELVDVLEGVFRDVAGEAPESSAEGGE